MGSLFGSGNATPTPPSPPPVGYKDEVNKVEQVPVLNADGSYTYITRTLPLSADEQAEQNELDSIMDEALAEIQKLSSADYNADAETQKVLNAWEAEQRTALERQQVNRTTEEEKSLAQRGLADSAAARDIRRQRQLDEQNAAQSLSNQTDLLGQDIRNDLLSQQYGLYQLAASENNATNALQQQSAVNGLSASIAATNANRASVLDYYYASQEGDKSPSMFGQLATLGMTAAGAYYGGPTGAAAGNTLGNALFSNNSN